MLGLPCGSVGKESTCNTADLGSIPGLGRSPGKGKDYPLQYSGLENSMSCIVHGVEKRHNWATFTFASLLFLMLFLQFSASKWNHYPLAWILLVPFACRSVGDEFCQFLLICNSSFITLNMSLHYLLASMVRCWLPQKTAVELGWSQFQFYCPVYLCLCRYFLIWPPSAFDWEPSRVLSSYSLNTLEDFITALWSFEFESLFSYII